VDTAARPVEPEVRPPTLPDSVPWPID